MVRGGRPAAPLPAAGLFLLAATLACSSPPDSGGLATVEAVFLRTRTLADQIDVTTARVADASIHGVPLAELRSTYAAARDTLVALLETMDSAALAEQDQRVFADLRRTVARSLGLDPEPAVDGGQAAQPDCRYDPVAVLVTDTSGAELSDRIMDCYGAAAGAVMVDGDTLDRLSIFGLLRTTPNGPRRRRLFLALEPVWRSVNADGSPTSAWRLLLQARAPAWQRDGMPHVRRARALGVEPDSVEPWLVRALEAWRATEPAELVEPWDWYFRTGEASRILEGRVPRERLLAINHEFYRALGADPESLHIQYDLDPRPGKYPVAYTTFGARPGMSGEGWSTGEPWVFANYRGGGFGNLQELLHETGHGVHIAAIRTRPAWATWPDSDTFTEAVAELASLDAWAPAWQLRYLGDSVSSTAGRRGEWGSTMLDLVWALFEIRMFRDPALDPNQVWADLTSRYLGIRPHPEWSWWAMRGQLIGSPGYMLNYSLGAFLVTALRERIQAERGVALGDPDPGWYGFVSERLFRYGRERPSAEVVREFLGGPLTPDALLRELK